MERYAKAVVGAIVAGLGVVELAQADNLITAAEWVRVAIVTITALGLVWGVQNGDKPVEPVEFRGHDNLR